MKYITRITVAMSLSFLIGCVGPENALITTEDGSVIQVDPEVTEPCEAQYGKGSRPDTIGAKYGQFKLCYDPQGNFKAYPQLTPKVTE